MLTAVVLALLGLLAVGYGAVSPEGLAVRLTVRTSGAIALAGAALAALYPPVIIFY